jgi:hypothetical protein
MLRARCSAALCRLVYPDVLFGVYAEGEIEERPPAAEVVELRPRTNEVLAEARQQAPETPEEVVSAKRFEALQMLRRGADVLGRDEAKRITDEAAGPRPDPVSLEWLLGAAGALQTAMHDRAKAAAPSSADVLRAALAAAEAPICGGCGGTGWSRSSSGRCTECGGAS